MITGYHKHIRQNRQPILAQEHLDRAWLRLGIEKAYFLNLPQCIERRNFMEEQLSIFGLDPICVQATDIKELPPVLCDGPMLSSPREQACLVSHLRLAASIADGPDELVLVLEDDCVLGSPHQQFDLFERLPPQWEILQLGSNNANAQRSLQTMWKIGLHAIRWEHSLWGAYGYLLKRSGARRLCDRFLTSEGEIDLRGWHRPFRCVADFVLFESLETFSLCYPLAVPHEAFPSTIGHPAPLLKQVLGLEQQVRDFWLLHGSKA